MINTDSTMEEVRKIKEELSLEYLSQTPEERKQAAQRARERFEKSIGRQIKSVDYSKSRESAKEELAQV